MQNIDVCIFGFSNLLLLLYIDRRCIFIQQFVKYIENKEICVYFYVLFKYSFCNQITSN